MPPCRFLFRTPHPCHFPRFWASSKVLFPFTFSSCLISPVWLVLILSPGRRCLAGVREVRFRGGRLQDGAEVDSRRTAENLTSTHVRMTLLPKNSVSKTKKKSKARWWKNYMPKPQHIQKIPPKPCRHCSPCIINEWQLCSPMDSTWNMM